MNETPSSLPDAARPDRTATALVLMSFAIIAAYTLMIDLKGVSTDEGIRLGIINGGRPYVLNQPPADPGWEAVIQTNWPFAYQPLYFLMQRTLMSIAQTQDVVFLRLVNVGFLWLCLQGLITLSRAWRLLPRLFLLGVFGFNAYLLMHVLQIREYIVGVAFYIWSTWFVLRLGDRQLGRAWADVGWFTAYGLLLVAGFYTQSWVVFPAIGQFLYLVARRRPEPLRFYTHLALSYLVVYAATWPYLISHRQKVDVGRWGREGSDLLSQLADGFQFVLSGHLRGEHLAMDLLCWFWLLVLAAAIVALRTRASRTLAPDSRRDFLRQGSLMVVCMAVPLAVQVAYFLRYDNLSVWARYFIVHYFFLFWLLGLGVRHLHELSLASGLASRARRTLRGAVGLIVAVMAGSAVYQVASYYHDPFLDTGLSRESNWRILARELSLVLEPDDVVLTQEFINRSTLSFTRPLAHRIIILAELEEADLGAANRLIFLEYVTQIPQRAELAARASRLGFSHQQVLPVHASDGQAARHEWRFVVFTRQ
ncbi:MAG: hypothetical protein KF897_11335 [Opitutaceae bacterium]|nr:hypothetical protein [Opitutaceae bacterium]